MMRQALIRVRLATIMVLSGSMGVWAAEIAEWNQWQGPNRDAISMDTGLLRQWPEGGPKLVWKATGLGGGFAGVSFWADRIFTVGDKEDGSYLLALSRTDGKPLWSVKVGRAGGNDPQRPGPRCTPATDGTLVVALGQYGELVCVEAATGKDLWRKSYQEDFGGTAVPKWNFSESPLLDGERLICLPGGPKGYMVALKKQTGELLWQAKDLTGNTNYTSAIVAEIGGVRQYIALTDAQVAGVAAADGKVLWTAPRTGKVSVIPTPICRDGIVFVTSGYGVGCSALRITAANGAFKAEPIYADAKIANHHGGAILVGDYVYTSVDPGLLTCLEFKTGKVVWQDKGVGKGSLGYADGNLILRSENGPVALVEATSEGYKEKGRFDQPDRSKVNSWPHPVATGGRLYLRDQDVLLCYDLKAGS